MPQTTVSSRQQSIMGAERQISEVSQTETPTLPKTPPKAASTATPHQERRFREMSREPISLNRLAPQQRAADTERSCIVVKEDVADEFVGPVEDGIPIPLKGSAAKFECLKLLKVGQSRWIKRKSGAITCSRLGKESGLGFVWAAETRNGVQGSRVWRVQSKPK